MRIDSLKWLIWASVMDYRLEMRRFLYVWPVGNIIRTRLNLLKCASQHVTKCIESRLFQSVGDGICTVSYQL